MAPLHALCFALSAAAAATHAAAQVALGAPVFGQQFPDVVLDFSRARLRTVDAVGSTWEWDGGGWRLVARGLELAQRRLVQDTVGRRTIQLVETATTREQREWDGHAWQTTLTAGVPPLGPMAFDSARNRAVLVDVAGAAVHEWDGQVWTLRGPAPTGGDPFPRLVFDFTQQSVLLLTRPNATGVLETHAWNGVSWQLLATGGPTDGNFACAFDLARGKVVAHGGGSISSTANTWLWDGQQWTIQAPTPLFARRLHAMAFDPARGEVVAFGGMTTLQETRNDAWAWNGAAWQAVGPLAAPPLRHGAALAYDAARDRAVWFGGASTTAGLTAELWEWDGLRWQQTATPLLGPVARFRPAMATGLAGGVLMFGGSDLTSQSLSDLWRWDGVSWTQLAAVGPPARWAAGLALDAGRGRVVLHGGYDAGVALSDTWEWDGALWANVSGSGPVTSGPTAALTPDPSGVGVLCYERANAGGVLRWNGQSWSQFAPAAPQYVLGIAGDPGSNRVLAFTSPGAGIIATLAWTGTNWAPFGSTAAPFFGRFDDPVVGAVGDSHRGRVLLQTDSLLWQVGGMPADVRDIGPSCGSPGLATPTLTSFGLPRIGDPGHSLDLRAAPASLGVLGLSLATATLSFGPGCDWRIGVGASLLVTMGPAGDRAVPMPIPDDPVLRGLAVFAQFGVLAPTATYGVLLSAPAQLTVGD